MGQSEAAEEKRCGFGCRQRDCGSARPGAGCQVRACVHTCFRAEQGQIPATNEV